MKQIIGVTSDPEKLKQLFGEGDFHINPCGFTVEEIIRVRDCSNILFLHIADEDPDELKRVGLYLRDLCIEEEKFVYLYGNRMGVDILKARIPSLYVRKAIYTFASPLGVLVEDLLELEKQLDGDQPSLLIIDDDTKFIKDLRLYLDPVFRVFVSHNDISESGALMMYADMVLVSTTNSYTLPEFLELYQMLVRRKSALNFRLYYLAQDDEERIRLSAGHFNINSSFILSKETESFRIANYLKEMVTRPDIGLFK